jgi:hypothetical protein
MFDPLSPLGAKSNFAPLLPDAAFDRKMTIHPGGREIRFFYLGPGQRAGDTFVAFPHARLQG